MTGATNLKLVISPHIDDDVLGCGGIIDKNTHVLYCGIDETNITGDWVRSRPTIQQRLTEADAVKKYLGHDYTLLSNQVNHYNMRNLIPSFEEVINKIKPNIVFIPHPSYNQDHQEVYKAAAVALRPHDINWFVNKVCVYEQPHVQQWDNNGHDFKPNYFIEIDIKRKIHAYSLMATQVRSFRSDKQIETLAQLRGAQCNKGCVEAFQILRWI